MKIAYIEDDKMIQELMINLLRNYNMEIIPFLSVDRFDETKPDGLDLILSDGNIGNKSAYDTYTTKLKHYKTTPFWLYSGNDDLIHTFKKIEIPVYEKPKDMTKLLYDLKIMNTSLIKW